MRLAFCCWLGMGCGSLEIPEGEKLPDLGEPEPALSAEERALDPASVERIARDHLERRETPGRLVLAIALLRFHWPGQRDAVSPLLAEAHFRVVDGLEDPAQRSRKERHLRAGLFHARAAPESGSGLYWHGQLLLQAADFERSLARMKEARTALLAAERSAPEIDEGGPARMLGRIYQETPPLFGGSKEEAIRWYRKSLAIAPDCLRTRLWLAETLSALGQKKEAWAEVERILTGPPRPRREREDGELREKARKFLEK